MGYGYRSPCSLLIVAAARTIASAYPTAGGIYMGPLLGGRSYGWVAAWFNLLGLMFVVSSVNFGVFLLFGTCSWATSWAWMSSWTSKAAFDQAGGPRPSSSPSSPSARLSSIMSASAPPPSSLTSAAT